MTAEHIIPDAPGPGEGRPAESWPPRELGGTFVLHPAPRHSCRPLARPRRRPLHTATEEGEAIYTGLVGLAWAYHVVRRDRREALS